MLEDLLAEIAPDWETDGYGLSSNLICPHGNMVEQDGRSADCGCVSPLLTMGMI